MHHKRWLRGDPGAKRRKGAPCESDPGAFDRLRLDISTHEQKNTASKFTKSKESADKNQKSKGGHKEKMEKILGG
jgi:hypothetical protein